MEKFYQCDELFCPEKSAGQRPVQADDNLKTMGVNVEIGERRKVELYNSRINRKTFEVVRTPPKNTKGQKDLLATQQGPDNSPDGGKNHETSSTNQQNGGSPFYSKGSSQGDKSHVSSSGSLSGGNSQIKASRLKGSIDSTGRENTEIQTGGGADFHTNLALLNKQNSRMGFPTRKLNPSKKRVQPIRPSLGSSRGQSPGGSFGSSGKKAKKPKSFLSKLASSLGFGRYFGTPGKRSSSYQKRGYNYGRSGLKTKNFHKREKLKTPSDILKERFNRQFKRGLANSLEFETSKTSIFQKMCEHYDNYTRANNIPDSRRFCPKSQ